jgi:hypothetical protein
MPKKKPDELKMMDSVAGVHQSIVNALVTAVRKRGGSFVDFHRLTTPEGAHDIEDIAKLIVSAKKHVGFTITYDQSIGLVELIRRAFGSGNVNNFNSDITQERFPLKGKDILTVNVRVEPFLNGETGEQAAKRLVAAGHTLANSGDLAGFLASHPKEVEKWAWVFALSEDSRWTSSRGIVRDPFVRVPCACVHGSDRSFGLGYFCHELRSDSGILVLRE